MSAGRTSNLNARLAATRAVAQFILDLPIPGAISLRTDSLSESEAGFARVLYQQTVRRWLTIVWIVRKCLRQKPDKLEPDVLAAIAVGVTQLLWMERVPVHAAVYESVEIAKRGANPRAAPLVNVVLRKVSELMDCRDALATYKPAVHDLPLGSLGVVRLNAPILPPIKTQVDHLSVAMSHPPSIVRQWIDQYGSETAHRILLHDLQEPPTILFSPAAIPFDHVESHAEEGFYLWKGSPGALTETLEKCGGWVQDPASHQAVARTRDLPLSVIVDYCAGRGTKTMQLRMLHPDAKIYATDPDTNRFEELQHRFQDDAQVFVLPKEKIFSESREADLVLLDVPCGNSGVFARRVEARYRDHLETLNSLIALQRSIIDQAVELLSDSGRLLYCTCSIDPRENQHQTAYAKGTYALHQEQEETILPGGKVHTYHDGGYYALLRKGAP